MSENLKRLLYLFTTFILVLAILIVIFKYDLSGYNNFSQDYKIFLDKKSQRDALDKLSSQLESLNLNIQAIQQNASILNLFLPPTPEQENLIAIISDVIQRSGIQFSGLRFNIQTPRVPQVVQNQTQTPLNETVVKPLTEIEINLDFVGTYDQLKTFVSNAEKSARLLDIANINIASGKGGSLSGSIKLIAYSQ